MSYNYEVVLFDADGTLFDFRRAERYALEQTFAELGLALEPQTVAAYEEVNHAVWREFERGELSTVQLRVVRFERFCGRVGIGVDPREMSTRYLGWLGQANFLLTGAEELIEGLSGRFKLAIVTNGLQEVQRSRFARTRMSRSFDATVISEEIGVQKPDPAIFDQALQLLGHREKERVLMVGDSLSSDIQGGVNFGIDTCWYNPQGSPLPHEPVPRYVVRSLAEILPLCTGGSQGVVSEK